MLSETNCLIAQSGGPTAVINASLAGVIKKAIETDGIHRIYGALNGITGVLEDNIMNLSEIFESNLNNLDALKTTPAMYLGSCRHKLSDFNTNNKEYETIFSMFEKYNIKYFFYIGGNDSMDTVAKLSNYAKKINFDISIMGIPKTIDNDLMCIDHTPGYGSAAKYIASSVLEIAHDTYIYDKPSVTIIEIMGRNAGWLTAAAALARNEYSQAPHLIYLPEVPFSTEQFIEDIKTQLTNRKQVIVAVSEGIKDSNGTYISAQSEQLDQFGHIMLSGTGKVLEQLVKNNLGCKVRSIELNVLQRCSSHIGSTTDMEESFSLGETGVNLALKGVTGEMVILTRTSNSPYSVTYSSVPIQEVANHEKLVPIHWITKNGNDITSDLIEYMYPLIQGEPNIHYENGVPAYLPVNHLFLK